MNDKSGATRRTVLTGVTGLAAAATIPLVAATASAGDGFSAVDQPRVYSCDEWGARPPNGTPVIVQSRPNKIIVHHTAFPNTTDYSLDYAFQNSRDIQDLHMDDNGWSDSGQHFTNSRGGFLTEGRRGSLDALLGGTTMIQGAHCVGQNSQAIGIENDGSYHLGAPVPAAQWDSLVQFCAFICRQYGVPAEEIHGHKDFNSTLCPGGLWDRLPELRAAVAGLLG
ncbi:peptidoglycan recognition family protein [Phytomonospora sp. NPDC050363]|uniref:peptidoglycan recognition protein family protein n=1 Tax=Phytomonospora sp. NPDC050363 TaxID=3155642 RepID=UPI0033C62F27